MNESESYTRNVRRSVTSYRWNNSSKKEVALAASVTDNNRTVSRSRSGSSVNNFKLKLSRHIDATSTFNGSRDSWTRSSGYVETLRGLPWIDTAIVRNRQEGLLISPSNTPYRTATISTTSADNNAKASFLSRLQNAQRSFQGGVFLGELTETLHLMRNPARGLRNLLDSYHSRIKKYAPKVKKSKRLGFVADQWLEYSFGMLPLISDIEDAGKAINRLARQPGEYQVLYAEGSDSSVVSLSNISYGVSASGCAGRRLVKDECKVIYRGSCECRPFNPVEFAAKNFGFSPQDFVPTLWELIPYSFLVDYFTNIGDIISGWSWQRSGLKWSNKTTIRQGVSSDIDLRPTLNGASGWSVIGFAPYTSVFTRRTVSRASYYGNFTPSLEFQIPGMGMKWLNISALAVLRSPGRLFHL